MKKLLLMLIIGICAIALRMPEVAGALGISAGAAPSDTAVLSGLQSLQTPQASHSLQAPSKPMTAAEFAELSKTDPQAYRKYLDSHVAQPVERTEIDKLMNFLARGKFE